MLDVLTVGEIREMIEEIAGSKPWLETYFRSNRPDQPIAKVALADGSEVWFTDTTRNLALAGLLQFLQADGVAVAA